MPQQSGYRVPPPKQNPWGAVVILAALAAGGWYFFGGGLEQQAANNLGDIYAKVASDAVDKYNIAKRSGTKMDVCVQAGLVSASFLQAKNDAQYRSWKTIEASDCEAAGLTR